MIICAAAIIGAFFSILGIVFIRPISIFLGAEGELLENCVIYGRTLFTSETAFILQYVFQSFCTVAEKPELTLKISIAAGLTNMVLDVLFIAVFQWGIAGAAAATCLGEIVGGIVPLIYFARKNSSLLQLGSPSFYGRALLKACTNGSSEMVTNLSASAVNVLYNFQLMRLAGENGVAAYGIIMYVNFIFMGIYLGYAIGSAPIVAYHYGAGNHSELKNMLKKSLTLVSCGGLLLTLLAELLNRPLVMIFASYDQELLEMTCHGFRLYAIAFLLIGISVWGSSFFTALGNGAVSAAISFLRTLVFEIGSILLLPLLLGINGIWLSIVVAEIMSVTATFLFLAAKRKQYHYW